MRSKGLFIIQPQTKSSEDLSIRDEDSLLLVIFSFPLELGAALEPRKEADKPTVSTSKVIAEFRAVQKISWALWKFLSDVT